MVSQLPEAPTFYPTDEEFAAPYAYLARIRPVAEQAGIIKIVPPASWKPAFSMRSSASFATKRQNISALLKRHDMLPTTSTKKALVDMTAAERFLFRLNEVKAVSNLSPAQNCAVLLSVPRAMRPAHSQHTRQACNGCHRCQRSRFARAV